jgi:HAE1 family hydrophobic/amphiphilic exporter-1
VTPLVFATGAGRAARHSVGTSVAGGMLVSTILNLVIIPVLYVAVQSLLGSRPGRQAAGAGPAPEGPHA